jgi:CRP-like cAMP-binding protein
MSHALRNLGTNRLLANLPPDDGTHLASFSRIEHPPQGSVLISPSKPGTDVWFPHAGAVALITADSSGRSVHTGIVGCEGCVGLEALLGAGQPVQDTVVQIDGAMSVIPANHLRTAFDTRPQVRTALMKFLHGLLAQSLQTIACDRLHSLLSRCCRWLLTMQDTTNSDDISITQDNLAALLGGSRPRVNLVLAALEKDRIVHRARGHIQLLSRVGLERNTCECYKLVRDVSGWLRNNRS